MQWDWREIVSVPATVGLAYTAPAQRASARSSRTAPPAPVESADCHADRAIMTRIAAGQQAALGYLYERHATMVYSIALRIVRRPADAEDVTQQVFTQAWTTARRYEGRRGAVAAWLTMISRSRAIDCLRQREARPGGAADGCLAAIADPGPSAECALVTREQIDGVRAALATLPETQRVALELAYYSGLSHRDIAQRSATPLGTVKTRVRRALQTLREAMTATAG